MSFTLQTGVTLDTAPIVLERCAEASPRRSMARAIAGQAIVTEIVQTQAKAYLRLGIAYMTDSQRATLQTALSTAGPRTVYTGGETVSCIPADQSMQHFEELVTPGGYPDKDSAGSTLPTWMTVWRAEITYIRLV